MKMIASTLVASASMARAQSGDGRYIRALAKMKHDYAKVPHPNEASRVDFVTGLVRLREEAARSKSSAWQAIDAEVKRHPVPNDSDSKALSRLLVGKWESPRHDYLYEADGTWTMLPVQPDITHGTWHIEGNQYFDTAAIDPQQTSQYTIILISERDFVFTDKEVVFYEKRLK